MPALSSRTAFVFKLIMCKLLVCLLLHNSEPHAEVYLNKYRFCLFNVNILLLYKQILKPIWTYGIQMWGCTKQSNIDIIKCMVNAPWYVRNNDLHRDLQVNVVSSEIQRFAQNMKGGFTIMRTVRSYCSWTTRA